MTQYESWKPNPTTMAIINSVKPITLNPQFSFFRHKSNPLKAPSNLWPQLVMAPHRPPHQWRSIKSSMVDEDIEMVKTKEGIYTSRAKKVVVLWDLDNKPPRGPPFEAAMALKGVAQKFGEVVDVSAYANRHAFIHLPQWVVQERRERRRLDFMERKGPSTPTEPYICSVCGRKYTTNMDLRKHFRQLHERERQKKLNRMRNLKGKKRQRYKERFIDGNEKYNEAARGLLTPKIGYGLAQELKRAGVFVKTVEDKPQAADWALKRQMLHSMSRGVDWIVLVSDDSDFSEMLRKAKNAKLGTVVVGDRDRALSEHADIWVPWIRVENREIKESDLKLKSRGARDFDDRTECSTFGEFDGENLDNGRSLDELFEGMKFDGLRISCFSEGEEEDDWMGTRLYDAEDQFRVGSSVHGDGDEEGDYSLDSEDDELGDDAYFL